MEGTETIDLETDLDSVLLALDQEPAGPEFALGANRFLQAKAQEKSRRRGLKKWIRPENALAILPYLPAGPEDRTHAVLRGDFVLCDLIPAIIREHGRCPQLHIATLGMSAANAEQLASLHQAGLIGEITICCSHYFRQVDKATTWLAVESALEGIAKLVVARNHAKVICLPTEGGDHFVIEGSANLRSSDNLEQIAIFNDAELVAFHRAWMAELEDRVRSDRSHA